MMCDKWCIANFNGECIADECKGAICSIQPPCATKEQAKARYEMSVSALEDYFREDEE